MVAFSLRAVFIESLTLTFYNSSSATAGSPCVFKLDYESLCEC